jgi:hypothetical protein
VELACVKASDVEDVDSEVVVVSAALVASVEPEPELVAVKLES